MKKEPKFIRCTKCKHKLKMVYNPESLEYILVCYTCSYGVRLNYDSEPEMSLIKEDYRHALKDIFKEDKK